MYFNFVCVLQVNLNEMFHQTGQNMAADCLSDLFTQIYINLTKIIIDLTNPVLISVRLWILKDGGS